MEAALRETQASAGGIDILVNNAGIAGPNMPTWEYPVDDWRRVIDIDLNGPFVVSRAVVPLMKDAGWGRIVNIASVAGKEGNPQRAGLQRGEGRPDRAHQEPGQGAGRLRRAGELRDACGCGDPHLRPDDPDPHRHDEVEDSAMGRFGLPQEIAAMVAWLCSEDCSFSTGGVFDLSGGRATY